MHTIEDWAFTGCQSLRSIRLPDGIKSIGSCCFQSCTSLTSVFLPQSVRQICAEAFSECRNLQTIHLPDLLTSIEDNAFSGCESLSRINLPDHLTELDNHVFSGCTSLSDFEISPQHPVFRMNGQFLVNIRENKLIYFAGGRSDKEIIVPDGIEVIAEEAFAGRTHLERMHLLDY